MGWFPLIMGSTALAAAARALNVGAGGFVRGVDINPDGTMFAWTDVYGAYVYNSGTNRWSQLITPTRMPSGDPTNSYAYIQTYVANQGVWEVRSAPSNSQIVYMNYLGYVFKSTNQGASFTNLNASFTPLTPSVMPANDSSLLYNNAGPKMAIDPINASVVWNSFASGSPYQTTNGGTSWTQITAVPAPTAGTMTAIAFSPRVADQSGGFTQVMYAFPNGQGCYKSTNAGSSWTKISGSGTSTTGLTSVIQMFVDSQGNVWVTDRSGGNDNIWKYNGTSWTNFSLSGQGLNFQGAWSICEDPGTANAQRIVAMTENGIFAQTLDGGTTWHGGFSTGSGNDGTPIYVATDVPYLATITDNPVVGFIKFNPITGKLVQSTGVGMYQTTPPTTLTGSPTVTWTSFNLGIEELVSNQIISSPSGGIIAGCYDRAFLRIVDPTYPSVVEPKTFSVSPGGASVDWATGNTSTWAAVEGWGTLHVTNDNGNTWVTHTCPTGGGGLACIAAANSTNFVYKPNGGNLQYTTNAGVSWTDLGSYFNTNFGIALSSIVLDNDEQTICSDRVNVGTFYTTMPDGKIYVSTNGGAAWSVHSTIPTVVGGNPMLRSVLGKANHLIYCAGQTYQGSHPYTATSSCQIYKGTSWADFGGGLVRDVWAIGTGPQVGTYPRIAFWGWVSVAGTWTPGVWYTDDGGSTFTKLCEQTIHGTYDLIKWLEINANDANKIYFGFTGSGFGYYGT